MSFSRTIKCRNRSDLRLILSTRYSSWDIRLASMHFQSFLTFLALCTSGLCAQVQTLYQFPKDTWIENLAVRSCNDLLLTLLTSPELYMLDPESDTPPTLIYTFPAAQALFGIAETSPDIFAVISGNFTLAGGSAPGSYSVWGVDMREVKMNQDGAMSSVPLVVKIADILSAEFLNGMALLSSAEGLVLLGDIAAGVVYRLDISTGQYEIAIANSLTATANNPVFGNTGVNGIQVHEGQLYIANTGQALFGRLPIYPNGTEAGDPVIIARALNASEQCDDFAVGKHGYIFAVTGSGDSVEEITPRGRQTIIDGRLNSTQFAEPTSARFGRGKAGKGVLYVVTALGLSAPVKGD